MALTSTNEDGSGNLPPLNMSEFELAPGAIPPNDKDDAPPPKPTPKKESDKPASQNKDGGDGANAGQTEDSKQAGAEPVAAKAAAAEPVVSKAGAGPVVANAKAHGSAIRIPGLAVVRLHLRMSPQHTRPSMLSVDQRVEC